MQSIGEKKALRLFSLEEGYEKKVMQYEMMGQSLLVLVGWQVGSSWYFIPALY